MGDALPLLFVCLFGCLFGCLFVCLFVWLVGCLCVCVSVSVPGTADGADVSGTVHVEEVSETDIDDVEVSEQSRVKGAATVCVCVHVCVCGGWVLVKASE